MTAGNSGVYGVDVAAGHEFGFLDGGLRLFQLRPFLDSKTARGTGYLQRMESRAADTSGVRVDMNGVPGS